MEIEKIEELRILLSDKDIKDFRNELRDLNFSTDNAPILYKIYQQLF